jgi:uncharacterized membrane protein YhaH (DUF805 family)
MTFIDAIKSGFKNYANFKGFAARSEYWYWTLFAVLLQTVTKTIDQVVGTMTLGNIAQLALIVPGLAVAARRLRDSGRSPLWLMSYAAIGVSVFWLIFTFIAEYVQAFGSSDSAALQAALEQFNLDQTGPIADAIVAGTFNGSLAPLLVTLVVSMATGITLLVFFCSKTKTAAQGNKYATDAPAAPIDNGGTTA